MKRALYLLSLLVAMFCLGSCKDNYYIENELHGMWQVTSIERFSTGEVTDPQGRIYYSFQRTMVMLGHKSSDIPESISNCIAHFDIITPDSIAMGDFRVSTTGEGDNVNKEHKISLSYLNKFGLYTEHTKFHMQRVKRMLSLTSDSAHIVLRRY